MFSHIVKGLAGTLAIWLFRRYRRLSLDIVKIESAALYIKSIRGLRAGTISVMLAWLGVFIFALGVLLAHAGLFLALFLIWRSWLVVALVMLALGLAYVLTVALLAASALSEARWLKSFQADELVRKLTASQKSDS